MNRIPPTTSIYLMKSSSNWLIPAGLLALTFVPAVAGALRLSEMAGGATVIPDGDRVTQSPVALVAHILSVTVFGVLGAFQFAPGVRRRFRRWHRIAGRIVAPAGLIAAVSGLWLTVFLPAAAVDSIVLSAIRVVVVAWMVTSLVLGVTAALRRDFTTHRAWMIRGYAIGMGAGTQFFTQAAWLVAVGPFTPASRTATMAAAWLINVLVAEWLIRRRAKPAVRYRSAVLPQGSIR
jgi:preprotein translocase subunit SecG